MEKPSNHDALGQAINALDQRLNGYKVFLKYAIPDGVLFQLGLDVLEQSMATSMVAPSDVPRAAVVNARAAFEASMDLLLLVAEPSLYDEFGAFIRVCELLTSQDLYEKRDRVDAIFGFDIQVRGMSTEEIVEIEAKRWEEDSPGVTRMYQRVLEQAREQKRWKHHWSGIATLRERARFISTKLDGYEVFVELVDVFWSLQSIHTHPGPRTGVRESEVNAHGQLMFRPRQTEGHLAIDVAGVACHHATDAMTAREQYIK